MINIMFDLLPFISEIGFIRGNYFGTIIFLYEVSRFLFLMSFFALIIFLYLLIYHIFKLNQENISDKYGLNCFFFYSSFNEKDFNKFSITMGVWVFCFFTFSFMFYFIL